MPTKLMLVFVAVDLLFAGCGGLILAFSLISERLVLDTPTVGNVTQNLLLGQCPLTAGVVNAIFVFATFLFSLPALFLPTNRGWLRAQGWLVVICATYTLSLGIAIWVETLQIRRNLSVLWGRETPQIQSLLQQKYDCCGYVNSTTPPFIQDSTCLNTLVAELKGGCVGKFSSASNRYLDQVFTAAFGVVGVDVILVLCVAMVLKHRMEQERYRHIDEKNGDR
ncbi:tetraspanin [Dothidotthia symphoricarpi CBS 119687]|uniref:Tetraspanin n=1 Tax=Dothidotthia symphoricarpi CBS 119687 TaxID=1392245 RepID=A0A6A6AIW1_9PLEO|nr:tetraspanin [Dothidotthia symphoricarpi CBS 119687]KAF2130847.1 tetraspanin [Dothidotthia symphoricarpi CBS 119687]